MTDSEHQEHYGLDYVIDHVDGMYTEIQEVRHHLLNRMKTENYNFNRDQKRELRVLWRKMNRAYKKLLRSHDLYVTKKQMNDFVGPWVVYHKELLHLMMHFFPYQENQEGDGGDIIHGMDWEKEKGGNKNSDKQMKTSLTGLLDQLKTKNTRAR